MWANKPFIAVDQLKCMKNINRYPAHRCGTKESISILDKIKTNASSSYGYDASTDQFCDMIERGIIDPTKVVRSALENAESVVSMLLTTSLTISEAPKKEQPHAPHNHGGDDMD